MVSLMNTCNSHASFLFGLILVDFFCVCGLNILAEFSFSYLEYDLLK